MKNARWLVVPMVSLLISCNGGPQQTAEQPPTEPHSNLLQLMAAIPFPNSNIVFDTQIADPGAAGAIDPDSDLATLRYGGTYGGWMGVENAALAVAETANLLLIPGRVCSNGRPVPVEAEDFRRWTADLAQAGMDAYRAAQSRDQDEMILVAGDLTEACGNCHEKYRDTPNEPEDRCVP